MRELVVDDNWKINYTETIDIATNRPVSIHYRNGLIYRCSCEEWADCFCYERSLEYEIKRLRTYLKEACCD